MFSSSFMHSSLISWTFQPIALRIKYWSSLKSFLIKTILIIIIAVERTVDGNSGGFLFIFNYDFSVERTSKFLLLKKAKENNQYLMLFKAEIQWYLPQYQSYKGFTGTVVNQACSFLNNYWNGHIYIQGDHWPHDFPSSSRQHLTIVKPRPFIVPAGFTYYSCR